MLSVISTFSWRDLLDVLFLAVVAYQLYIWFRGTKALRVLIGLVALGAVYSLAKLWGLFMTTWAFQVLWQVLVILLLILFQAEIRQVLEKVSPLRYLRVRKYFSKAAAVEGLALAAFELAAERVGAIIVFVRDDDPAEFLTPGQPVMGLPTPDLVKSIFNPRAPAHDGAVLIRDGLLTRMGVVLPLSKRPDLPAHYGTRHRAAFGLAERTDAVCLVVSEERGEVTTMVEAEVNLWSAPELLATRLKELLGLNPRPRLLAWDMLRSTLTANWRAKLASLALVLAAWLILAGQQDFTRAYNLPVEYFNTPAGLVLAEGSAWSVEIKASGSRRQLMSLAEEDLAVRVDLAGLSEGRHVVTLSARNVDLPLGVGIESVRPPSLGLSLMGRQENTGVEMEDAR